MVGQWARRKLGWNLARGLVAFSDQLSIQHLTVEPVIKDAILTDKVDNFSLTKYN